MKNYSKLFLTTLVAAGTLFAGTQFANATTYTDLEKPSGTTTLVDGDILANHDIDDSNFLSDSYAIGKLIGIDQKNSADDNDDDVKTWDEANNGWYEADGSSKATYKSYDAIALFSGNANLVTTGTVLIQSNTVRDSYSLNGVSITTKGVGIIVLSDSATWTNSGTTTFEETYLDYPVGSEIYLLGNSTLTNTGTLSSGDFEFDLKLFGNAKVINSGTISTGAYKEDVEMHGSSTLRNTSTGTIVLGDLAMYDSAKVSNAGTFEAASVELHGNTTFVNEGIVDGKTINSYTDGVDVEFHSKTAGTAKFQNYGEISIAELTYHIDFEGDDVDYNPNFKAVFENYGTATFDFEYENCGFDIEKSYDPAKYELTNADFQNKFEFINRGTVIQGSWIDVEFESFVKVTLVGGSTIIGNMKIGGSVGAYNSSALQNYSWQADSESLNVILKGSENPTLIQGDLQLDNYVTLSVSAEAIDGVYLERYSQQFWSGDLTVDSNSDFAFNNVDPKDLFLTTSGTFIVNNATYNWVLNTETGMITAAVQGQSVEPESYKNLQLSSGTKTFIDGDIISNREIDDAKYGSDSYELGVLIGVNVKDSSHWSGDSITWDSATNSWLEKWIDADGNGSDYDYNRFDALVRLSGNAQMITTGTVTLVSNNEAFYDNDYESNIYRNYETAGIVALTGNSKWTNNGTIVVENVANNSGFGGVLEIYLLDNAVLENTGIFGEDSSSNSYSYYQNFELYAFGNSKIINSGVFNSGTQYELVYFFDSSSFENTGTAKLGGVELYDNAKITNAGMMEVREMALYGNATVVNKSTGTIVAPEESYTSSYNYLNFSSKTAGTATFQNHGNVEISSVNFYIDLEDGTDDYNKNFKASIENYGTWTVPSYGSEIGFEAWLDKNYTNYTLTNADFENKFSFTNRGIMQKDEVDGSIKFSSFTNLTLVGGSQILGNVKIGDKVEVDVYSSSGHEELKFRADSEILNVILAGTDNPVLIDGNLKIGNWINLNVSAEGDPELRYKQQLWSGDLIADDYLEDTLNITAEEAFLTTSGTFVLAGTNYTWALDVATGTITAKSDAIGEEYTADDPTTPHVLGSKDILDFGTLDEYAGTVSGQGQIYSENNLEFSGDLSDFTGTLNVSAGTLTATADSELGAGTIKIASEMVIDADGGARKVDNAISGAGTLVLQDGAFKLSQELSVKALHVLENTMLDGTVKIASTVEAIYFHEDGVLSLNAAKNEKLSYGNATLTIEQGAKLDLSGTVSKAFATATVMSVDKTLLEKLESGQSLTIVQGAGTLAIADVEAFLASDETLATFAESNIALYSQTSNSLAVRGVSDASSLVAISAPKGLSSEFVNALVDAQAVAAVLESFGGKGFVNTTALTGVDGVDDPLLAALLTGNSSAAEKIVSNASPLGYAAMLAVPATTFVSDIGAISARLDRRRNEMFVPEEQVEIFAQATGTSVENDSGNDNPMFDFDTYGVLAGVDVRVNEAATLGFAVGYQTGDADIHNGGGKIDIDDFRLMAFASYTFEKKYFVEGGAEMNISNFDAKRQSAYGRSDGDTNGASFGVFVNVGATYDLAANGALTATPHVGLSYMYMSVSGFNENGGKALEIDGFDGNSLRASVGCEFAWRALCLGMPIRFGLDLSYAHDFLGDDCDIDYSLGGNAYSATAQLLDEDIFTVSPSIGIGLAKMAEIYASYAFDAGTDSTAHRGNVGFRLKF